MAEPRVPIVIGLDEDAASSTAAAFFEAFAAEMDPDDLASLPASEALAWLLNLDEEV